MLDFDLLEQTDPSPDPALVARQQAEEYAADLLSHEWNKRRDACKKLGHMGPVARPYLQTMKRLLQTDDDYEVSKAARAALSKLREVGIRDASPDHRVTRTSARQALTRHRELIKELEQFDEKVGDPVVPTKGYRMGFPRPYGDTDVETPAKQDSDISNKPVEYWSPAEVGQLWKLTDVLIDDTAKLVSMLEIEQDPLRRQSIRRKMYGLRHLENTQSADVKIQDTGDDIAMPSFIVLEAQNLANDLLSTDPEVRRMACTGLSELGEVSESFIHELEALMTDDPDQRVRRDALNAVRKLSAMSERRDAVRNTKPAGHVENTEPTSYQSFNMARDDALR